MHLERYNDFSVYLSISVAAEVQYCCNSVSDMEECHSACLKVIIQHEMQQD